MSKGKVYISNYPDNPPEWYWISGLHDACIIGTESFEFPFDYNFLSRLPSEKRLAKDIKIYPQITKNVRVDSKDAVLSDELVLEARDNVAKELGSDGRILLRKSGTEPVIRIMVEAKTEKTCRDCIDKVYSAMVVRKLVKQ